MASPSTGLRADDGVRFGTGPAPAVRPVWRRRVQGPLIFLGRVDDLSGSRGKMPEAWARRLRTGQRPDGGQRRIGDRHRAPGDGTRRRDQSTETGDGAGRGSVGSQARAVSAGGRLRRPARAAAPVRAIIPARYPRPFIPTVPPRPSSKSERLSLRVSSSPACPIPRAPADLQTAITPRGRGGPVRSPGGRHGTTVPPCRRAAVRPRWRRVRRWPRSPAWRRRAE